LFYFVIDDASFISEIHQGLILLVNLVDDFARSFNFSSLTLYLCYWEL